MREYIKKIVSHGKLEIFGEDKVKDEFENVRCEFSYDILSSKKIVGVFEIPQMYDNIGNKKFIFKDDVERELKGNITGSTFEHIGGYRYNTLNFSIDEFTRSQWFSTANPKRLRIDFLIPYISYLSRSVLTYHFVENDYHFKFSDEVYKILVNNIEVRFDEFASFVEATEPDSKMYRMLYPTIELNINGNVDESVEELKKLFDDVLLILSLVLDNKMRCFGYFLKLYDENDKIILDYEHRITTVKSRGGFVKKHVNNKFEEIFTKEKITTLVNNFINHENKDLIRTSSYDLLTSQELDTFEPRLVWTIFSLEGVVKIITNKVGEITKFGEVVNLACSERYMNVDLNDYNFLKSENDDHRWLITDYRNNIAHFNNKKFDDEVIFDEYKKVIRLARNLLLKYLDSDKNINDYPFP